VQHGFINGVCGLIREDTGRQHGNELLNLVDAATFHDVIIDENVLAKELNLK
jgi:hypothetical protein